MYLSHFISKFSTYKITTKKQNNQIFYRFSINFIQYILYNTTKAANTTSYSPLFTYVSINITPLSIS